MYFIQLKGGDFVHKINRGNYYTAQPKDKRFCALSKEKAKRYSARLSSMGVAHVIAYEAEEHQRQDYESLTIEQKADFIAGIVNKGWAGYFNTCSKTAAGKYEFYNAEAEETTLYTAAELVEESENYDKAGILAEWEEEQQ